jgi:hypothetical protein
MFLYTVDSVMTQRECITANCNNMACVAYYKKHVMIYQTIFRYRVGDIISIEGVI